MVMSYKCSNRRKLLFDQLRIRFNVVFMSKIGIEYQYLIRVVWAYTQIFQERTGCALIGACALIRTNTVCKKRKKILKNSNRISHVIALVKIITFEPPHGKTNNAVFKQV